MDILEPSKLRQVHCYIDQPNCRIGIESDGICCQLGSMDTSRSPVLSVLDTVLNMLGDCPFLFSVFV